MTNHLAKRIADTLGWNLAEVNQFSLPTLRELVRTVSPKLHHELNQVIHGPDYIILSLADVPTQCEGEEFEAQTFDQPR